MKRLPQEAAEQFAAAHFPRASVVFLAGSVVQGGATSASDLDIVVIDDSQPTPFRRTYRESGWIIEAFVLTHSTYRELFAESYNSAIPSLQRMCACGQVIRDDGSAASIAQEAREQLEQGPLAWMPEEIEQARYEITECLDDFAGSGKRDEDLCIAAKLAQIVPTFVLRTNRCWVGDGKWMARCLRLHNAPLCDEWTAALGRFFAQGDKAPLISLTERILQPYGGRLYEGFRQYAGFAAEEADDITGETGFDVDTGAVGGSATAAVPD